MSFLFVTLYEFGQFLRILLWISIPLVIVAVAVVSYLHYRRKQSAKATELLAGEGESHADQLIEPGQTPTAGEKPYQGLLWLKRKYEEDMEHADTRYYALREEFKKLEKNYVELRVTAIHLEQQISSIRDVAPVERDVTLAERNVLPTERNVVPAERNVVLAEGDTLLADTGKTAELLHEEKTMNEPDGLERMRSELQQMNEKLESENEKVKDLETRLESSSKLLMKMYKELASSLETNNNILFKNRAQETRVKGLVREFDAIGGAGVTTNSWTDAPSVDEDGTLKVQEEGPLK